MNAAERLAEVQARTDKATGGPWTWTDGVRQRLLGGASHDSSEIVRCAALLHPAAADAEFIAHARTDVPALVAALESVLELHKPVKRYVVDGYEEVSYESREQAVEETECDPRAVTEWVLCEECCRVEDGPDGVGPQVAGYANSDHPCTTYLTVQAAFEKVAS